MSQNSNLEKPAQGSPDSLSDSSDNSAEKSVEDLKKDLKFDISVICLLILTAIAVTATLMHLKAVMVPFVFAVFVYFMISPSVNWFEKTLRLPRLLAMSATLFLSLLIMVAFVYMISVSLKGFLVGAEQYHARVLSTMDWIQTVLLSWGFNVELRQLQQELQTMQVINWARAFTGEFMGFMGNFILVVIFLIFLFIGKVTTTDKVEPPEVFKLINSRISKYIWTKFLVSLATGLTVGIFLRIMGLDLAIMFGVFAFLLNFIPSVGSIVATLLPLPVALLQFGPGAQFILALAVPGVIQFTVGNIIEPKLLGESLDLHPVAILFFLVFWGIVWGLPGMFLAVPITAILKFVLEQFYITRPVANILAGRPY